MESFRHYEPTLSELLEDVPLKLILGKGRQTPQEFERSMREFAVRIANREKASAR